jgi:hypothetical protein
MQRSPARPATLSRIPDATIAATPSPAHFDTAPVIPQAQRLLLEPPPSPAKLELHPSPTVCDFPATVHRNRHHYCWMHRPCHLHCLSRCRRSHPRPHHHRRHYSLHPSWPLDFPPESPPLRPKQLEATPQHLNASSVHADTRTDAASSADAMRALPQPASTMPTPHGSPLPPAARPMLPLSRLHLRPGGGSPRRLVSAAVLPTAPHARWWPSRLRPQSGSLPPHGACAARDEVFSVLFVFVSMFLYMYVFTVAHPTI